MEMKLTAFLPHGQVGPPELPPKANTWPTSPFGIEAGGRLPYFFSQVNAFFREFLSPPFRAGRRAAQSWNVMGRMPMPRHVTTRPFSRSSLRLCPALAGLPPLSPLPLCAFAPLRYIPLPFFPPARPYTPESEGLREFLSPPFRAASERAAKRRRPQRGLLAKAQKPRKSTGRDAWPLSALARKNISPITSPADN
jgi:hypothetical protein